MKLSQRVAARIKRKKSIRKKIQGKEDRPRLSIFRSAKHIYVQIIDDERGKTLASASTLSAEVRSHSERTGNIEAAKRAGEVLAKRAVEKGIKQVVFDRNGFLYHGRIKALAESVREHGLEF